MKKFFAKSEGFTLVELMVVVAIIGILSAIAVPNFKKYQAKSKTSEAKLQLSAAYTAEQSFYSDYDTYHVCLKYMGFNPQNEILSRYYAVGFGSDVTACSACDAVATANGAVLGANACESGTDRSFWAAGKKIGSDNPITTFTGADVGGAAIAEDTFTLGAVGNVDSNFLGAGNASAFNINENKLIKSVRAGF